jgi:hypothetical protein
VAVAAPVSQQAVPAATAAEFQPEQAWASPKVAVEEGCVEDDATTVTPRVFSEVGQVCSRSA